MVKEKAVRNGILVAFALGLRSLVIKGDYLEVINCLNYVLDPFTLMIRNIIRDCHMYVNLMDQVSFVCLYHYVNKVVHALVKYGL